MALTKVTGSVIKDSVSLSGNVSVGGTLTYQDVTNVDALGIGTFRTGIKVLAGQIDVGSNIKIGNAGVITATSFVGNGAITINSNGSNRIITGSSTANTLEGEATFKYDGTSVATIDTSQTYATFRLDGNSGGAIEFYENGTRRFELYGIDAEVALYDRDKGAYHTRFKSGGNIELSDGNLLINTTTSAAGNLVVKSADTSSNQVWIIGRASDNTASVSFRNNGDSAYTGRIEVEDTNGMVFQVGSSDRLKIDTSGRLLLGQSSAYTVNPAGGTILGVFTRTQSNRSDFILSNQSSANNAGAALVLASHGQDYIIESTGSGNSSDGASSLTFSKSSTERFRLDSAGRFLKGLTSAGGSRSSTSVRYPHFQLSSPWSSGLGSYKIECTDDYPIIFIDSNASYANGSGAGVITWSVKDSSGDYCNTASVRSLIDDTPSNDSAPGRLEFMTTTSGASPTTKMTISSEGYVTKPNQPYFKANLASGVRITSTGYQVFGSAVHNNGGHYNTSDGKFTAPVTGLYWISSRINAYDRLDFQIRVNGTEVERGQYNTDNDQVGWWSNQLTTITYMTAGQYAQVYVTHLDQQADPGNWCSFMGYLIG